MVIILPSKGVTIAFVGYITNTHLMKSLISNFIYRSTATRRELDERSPPRDCCCEAVVAEVGLRGEADEGRVEEVAVGRGGGANAR